MVVLLPVFGKQQLVLSHPLFLFYIFYDMSGFNVIDVHTKQEQNKITMMFKRSHVTSGEDVR